MPTNRNILYRGIKYMVWVIPMLFIGPTIINSAFKNTGHDFFIPVLGFGVIVCIGAVVLMFKGLATIVKSMTDQ